MRTMMKNEIIKSQEDKFEKWNVTKIGRRIAISISKIKKIIAIKKNRREKGRRAEDLGLKPHSKGEDFSRSIIDFFETNKVNIIRIVEIIAINRRKFNNKRINWFEKSNFLIGS